MKRMESRASFRGVEEVSLLSGEVMSYAYEAEEK